MLAGAAATGVLFRWAPWMGCWCRAVIRNVNEYGPDRTLHCPNCGRDVLENRFKLIASKGGRNGSPLRWPRRGWNPAQVPFPNPTHIEATDKPIVLMSQIRLQGVTILV